MTESTRDLLNRHFEVAFDAPDGITKLRELILTLAMQGKLVEQDPNDSPASELLKEIAAEKRRLVKEGKIKQPKPLPPIKPDEVPYDLPKGWEWVRLGDIGLINPRNNVNDDIVAGFVPMTMISEGYSDNHQFEERPWKAIKKGYTHFSNGDIGMAKITPCFENAKSCVFSGLPNGIGAGTTELHIFRNTFSSVEPRFLLYYLKNPKYISNAVANMTGSAGQKRVPTTFFSLQLIPFPPLPEQQRIVARIDQLMARCDELEKLRKEREEMRLAVHSAAIKQLVEVPDGSAWEFIQEHFGELYSVKENVAELRKAILQLAVMGRLVEQDPNDPPASELLKEIEAEKSRLVKEGKIKKPKPLPPIKPEEVPYELPKGWKWVRLGVLTDIIRGITFTASDKTKEAAIGRISCLRTTNVQKNIEWEDLLYVDKTFVKNESQYLQPLDILMSMANSRELVGKVAIVKEVPTEEATFGGFLGVIRTHKVIPYYILNLLTTVYARTILIASASQTTNIANISLGKLNLLLIPLPPLPEQHRIVARIDQLMAMCDGLEIQIESGTSKQTELLNSVMEVV